MDILETKVSILASNIIFFGIFSMFGEFFCLKKYKIFSW